MRRSKQVRTSYPILEMIRAREVKTSQIVRGIWYIENQEFIDPPLTIVFYALEDEKAAPIQELIAEREVVHSKLGVIIRSTVAEADGKTSIFEITFWSQFKMYVFVGQRGTDPNVVYLPPIAHSSLFEPISDRVRFTAV